jgi:type II secretory pathway pseudopilin PulG
MRNSVPYYRKDENPVSMYGAPFLAAIVTLIFITLSYFGGNSSGRAHYENSMSAAKDYAAAVNRGGERGGGGAGSATTMDSKSDAFSGEEDLAASRKYSLTLPRRMHLPNFFSNLGNEQQQQQQQQQQQMQTQQQQTQKIGGEETTHETPTLPPLPAGSKRFQVSTNDVLLDDKVFDDHDKNPLVGFACSFDRIPGAQTQTYHVKSFTPKLSNPEATHHVTVFACNAQRMYKKFGTTKGDFYGTNECGTWPFYGEPDSPCLEVAWAYDKGAGTFSYPSGFGYKVGKGTAFDVLLTQVHYLYPRNKPLKMWNDDTGAIMQLDPYRPSVVDAGVLTIMKTSMVLKPGQDETVVHYSVGPENQVYANHLKDDFAKGDQEDFGVTLLAAHLHAHDLAKKFKLSVESPSGHRNVVKYIDNYGGYGKDQDFFILANRARVHREDRIVIECTFDTSQIKQEVKYGTNHDEEMCGPILMYYPKKVTSSDLDQSGYFSGIQMNSVMV